MTDTPLPQIAAAPPAPAQAPDRACAPDPGATHLPAPESFRAWLGRSLALLGLRRSTASLAADLSANTVARILEQETDLRLGSAVALERVVRREAAARGIAIPDLGRPT